MTAWYVRPDTGHSATRDGKTHATAWGGWAEVVWGGSGVKAADVLYVCGVHSLSSFIQTGSHGATPGNQTVISGGYGPDPGRMVFASGNFFFLIGKDYTTIEDLAVNANTSNALYLYPTGALTGVTIQRCALTGGVGAAIVGISASNGQSCVDLMIRESDFIGGSGATLGGAISWTVAASGLPISSLNRVTIHRNNFDGCAADRAVVQLRVESGANASATMADIVLTDNVFRNCATLGAEIVGPSLTGFPEYYGRNTGLRVTGNRFYDMTQTDADFNLGGAMGIGGFAPSLSPGFGENIISRNEGYRLTGPSGFLNLFYGTFDVFDNYAEDVIASQADGNALLVDHGCKDVTLYRNHFRRVIGNQDKENSGCGIMILNATNTTAYSNIVEGCKTGVYFGNKAEGQSSNVFNNSFLDCSYAGILALSTANLTGNLVRNNLLTGRAGAPSVLVKGGTMTGESHNVFHGFGAPSGHTLTVSDLTSNPLVRSDGRLKSGSPAIGAGTYIAGSDYFGNAFSNPPNIGAVEGMVKRTPLIPGKSMRAGSRAVMRV